MAVNRYKPHVLVLPEDDATRSLAVGFSDHCNGPIELKLPLGGWPKVLAEFEHRYVKYLRTYVDAHVVMVIDYDHEFASRLPLFQAAIPVDVQDRAYVLGCEDEAETLKNQQALKYGPLGATLAYECRTQLPVLWNCPQLVDNQAELRRLLAQVRPFLF